MAKTEDFGYEWTLISIPDEKRVSDIAITPDGATLFVSTRHAEDDSEGSIYRITSGGSTVSEVHASTEFDFNVVAIDPTDSEHILAGGGTYSNPAVKRTLKLLEEQIVESRISPVKAAEQIISEFRKNL